MTAGWKQWSRQAGRAVRLAAFMLLMASLTSASPVRAQTEQPAVPDAYKLNMMIRTTLIALNQANRTGNYTVLRDLAAPAFQRTNNAARLAEIFAELRKRDLDLSPILFFQPKLRDEPALTDSGLLRLTGFFETKPEQISFDMLFQPVEENWRLFGLAVDVAPPAQAQQSRNAPTRNSQQQSRSQPGATRDSATTELAQGEAELAAKPAFRPQKVAIPMPVRRPSAAPVRSQREAQQQAAEDAGANSEEFNQWPTTDEETSAQASAAPDSAAEEAGSPWSLWGN
jgi:hypothetical protein